MLAIGELNSLTFVEDDDPLEVDGSFDEIPPADLADWASFLAFSRPLRIPNP